MSCELPIETLFILNLFYKNRNFGSDSGYHSEKLKKLYDRKFTDRGSLKFKKAINQLKNEGYITLIKKKEDKYYISDINKTVLALNNHGYNITGLYK